jgi:hypothetical protein
MFVDFQGQLSKEQDSGVLKSRSAVTKSQSNRAETSPDSTRDRKENFLRDLISPPMIRRNCINSITTSEVDQSITKKLLLGFLFSSLSIDRFN